MEGSLQDYRVDLDAYHGPLDLLLYLIRRDEVDIHDIPVARLTEQYLSFLKTLKQLDINLAGEFLVMAATLLEVKSAMLSPKIVEGEEGDENLPASEDPTDPRYELIHQLLAYKKYKDAAEQLDERRETFAARFACSPILPDLDDEPSVNLDDVDVAKLVDAFQRVMEQVGKGPAQHEVYDDDTPIDLHCADIADQLMREGPKTLQQIFTGRKRSEMIGLFIATLELVRQRRLRVLQDEPGADVQLQMRTEEEIAAILEKEQAEKEQQADPKNADDYDWPNDKMKIRYERRQARRAKGEAVEEDEELEAEIAAMEAEEALSMSVPGGEAAEGAATLKQAIQAVEAAEAETAAEGADQSQTEAENNESNDQTDEASGDEEQDNEQQA